MSINQDTLDNLKRFDTPTISNVIELFDVRPRNDGYMDGRIQSNFHEFPPMVGFAATVQYGSDAPGSADVYQAFQDLLEGFSSLPGPAVPVIRDVDDPPVAAVFGEVMCSSFQAFGSTGLVTNGAGRDLEQVRGLGYPVFTGSTICSHGYGHLMQLGIPVRVGGLMVYQGDLLHGDANGVTNIPIDIATEVAEVADEYVAAEEIIIGYMKTDGAKSLDKLAELNAAVGEEMGKLRRRVSRKS